MFLVSKTAFLLGIAQIGGEPPDHLDFDTLFVAPPPPKSMYIVHYRNYESGGFISPSKTS